LTVISASPGGNWFRYFQKMLENATRVCGANFGVMDLWDGNNFSASLQTTNVPACVHVICANQTPVNLSDSGLATVVRNRQVLHV